MILYNLHKHTVNKQKVKNKGGGGGHYCYRPVSTVIGMLWAGQLHKQGVTSVSGKIFLFSTTKSRAVLRTS